MSVKKTPVMIIVELDESDDDFKIDFKDVVKHKKEIYEYDEGSGEEEFYYSEDFVSDSNGFLSLK